MSWPVRCTSTCSRLRDEGTSLSAPAIKEPLVVYPTHDGGGVALSRIRCSRDPSARHLQRDQLGQHEERRPWCEVTPAP